MPVKKGRFQFDPQRGRPAQSAERFRPKGGRRTADVVFNSIEFLYFFLLVYALYLALDHKWQNRMLLLASYFFYGWWDWRFLSLLLVSTVLDFACGLRIASARTSAARRGWLAVSLAGNLSMLGFFKYMNFFSASFASMLSSLGLQVNPWSLKVILPVGISFYTFQTLSYTLDVYRGTLKPTRKFLDFALFVSFFPQLVAGPIERASNLLGQMINPRTISRDKVLSGLYLIAVGLLKKIIIADSLARIVNRGYANYASGGWLDILIYVHAFALQIYGDFSGYSNIARGLSRLMGFDLMVNFNAPFAVARIPEFFARWHISLSTWVRDYVFKSLGRSGGRWRVQVNTVIAMTVMGLWHGANWTFVLWGFYFGMLQVGYNLFRKIVRPRPGMWNPPMERFWAVASRVFAVEAFIMGGILFRATSLSHTWGMLKHLVRPDIAGAATFRNLIALSIYAAPIIVENACVGTTRDELWYMKQRGRSRYLIALLTLAYVLYAYFLGANVKGGEDFIYFQF
ncbi:MAG: MBOAT family protein [Lentisphaerae bacterium]|nr:MBOAT family protein [Lentisphaerota bacterium]